MENEIFHYFIRISSRLFPSAEKAAAALFDLLPGVTQVEILGDQFGTYRFLVPTTIPTSRGVETQLNAAGIVSDVQAMAPLDSPKPAVENDRSSMPDN